MSCVGSLFVVFFKRICQIECHSVQTSSCRSQTEFPNTLNTEGVCIAASVTKAICKQFFRTAAHCDAQLWVLEDRCTRLFHVLWCLDRRIAVRELAEVDWALEESILYAAMVAVAIVDANRTRDEVQAVRELRVGHHAVILIPKNVVHDLCRVFERDILLVAKRGPHVFEP